ncbi:succinate dehydrogenase subunit 5, mitochondrial-like [Apium graveolens]|uniref:succinate dehydrogenase subunit 5, mitochondrial-like n=1 Tax=Apium graveolens TaxID=4045 RepID=UPI003D798962
MEKIVRARSLYRSIFHRSRGYITTSVNHQLLAASRRSSPLSTVAKRLSPDFRSPLLIKNMGSTRSFSEDVTHMPTIKDSEINIAIKDLLAADWSEIPSAVVSEANKALTKSTEDKSGQETLKNVLLAAEAVEEFTGKLVSLRMEIDDSVGLSGEDVKPLPDVFAKALLTAFQRYNAYLDAFNPDETFIRKKVENELGTRMIHLKMRCGGLGSEWGKITVLGTSGLSGSYVEHRA